MVLLTVLLLAIRCRACSFLVGSYNLTAEHSSHQLSAANAFQQRHGPDATAIRHTGGWTFLHNLLSMTGRPTTQPFVAGDGMTAVLFNGEIYNFRSLARRLGLQLAADASDGEVLLPAYARWETAFAHELHGEFAIVLVDSLHTACCW